MSTAHLTKFQNQAALKLLNRAPGLYEAGFGIVGDTLLVSVFVKASDAPSTLAVTLYQTTSDSPAPSGTEKQVITKTFSFTSADVGKTFSFLVTRLHNKPTLEALVAAGNMTFGIYVTVIANSDVVSGKTSSDEYLNLKVDASGRLVVTEELSDPVPSINIVNRSVLLPGQGLYNTQLIATRTAMKELNIGGRAACEGTLARYIAATQQQVPGGGFNSSDDTALWTFTGTGDPGTFLFSTLQSTEGAGSLRINHTDSNANNTQEVTYAWPTPQDLSSWRYVSANFYNNPQKIEDRLRTIQIRLTSGTAIRIYELSGLRNGPVFGVVGWKFLQGELENPTSTAGTGAFDISAVDSISLRMFDENNNNGIFLHWDDVKFSGALSIVAKIYSPAQTTQLVFDPVIIFEEGETLLTLLRSNATVSAEYQLATSGVDA